MAPPGPPPSVDVTNETAGSAFTAAAALACRADIAANEMSCRACVEIVRDRCPPAVGTTGQCRHHHRRGGERYDEDRHHEPVAMQAPVHHPTVNDGGAIEPAREGRRDAGRGRMARGQARCQHGRQRQRDHGRGEDRERHHDAELVEDTPDDAAHQRMGRKTATSDSDIEMIVPPPRRCPSAPPPSGRALLDVPHDVFEHHDGVVDDEADGQGKRQQRKIVDGIAEKVHRPEVATSDSAR